MRFHYDKKSDALYIRFNDQRYVESEEISEGLILDYDKSGKIIGFEVLDASKRFPREFQNQFSKKKLPFTLEATRTAPVAAR